MLNIEKLIGAAMTASAIAVVYGVVMEFSTSTAEGFIGVILQQF